MSNMFLPGILISAQQASPLCFFELNSRSTDDIQLAHLVICNSSNEGMLSCRKKVAILNTVCYLVTVFGGIVHSTVYENTLSAPRRSIKSPCPFGDVPLLDAAWTHSRHRCAAWRGGLAANAAGLARLARAWAAKAGAASERGT